jgi:hypothetical protein
MTALEWKSRYATNAVNPATANQLPHLSMQFTEYKPAICVPNAKALCETEKQNQEVTTTLYAHVLSANHAGFSAT